MTANCVEKEMLVLQNINDFKRWRSKEAGSLALVPTMGALHAGHVSLVRKAKSIADKVVLYIFVNPLQFGPKEDFGTYPRTPESDIEICREEGVDAVFMPTMSEIYPQGKDETTKVFPPAALADILEGNFRPGFFTGVATVLVKFFNIVQPNAVVFGEKDYQQLLVVRQFVHDLNMPLTVYGATTVREPDGLAVSSRNAYLNEEQRKLAPQIHQFLTEAAQDLNEKRCESQEDRENILIPIKQKFAHAGFQLQYLEARDADTLQIVGAQTKRTVLLVAAKLDNIRLIDNLFVD